MNDLDQLIQQTKERWERDIARQEGELIALERDINKTGERYGITDHENNSKSLHPLGNGHHSRDDVLGVPVEKQVLHKRAGERTEKVEER